MKMRICSSNIYPVWLTETDSRSYELNSVV